MSDVALLVTCEHAVNIVPQRWQHLFRGNPDILETHRGWDAGAAELARHLGGELSSPCFMARVSRLLMDHNRSPHNRSLWSEFSRDLAASEKNLLLDEFYRPFRDRTGRWLVARHDKGDRLVHLSVHTFIPVFDGKTRNIDIGLLYDPGRPDEVLFAGFWKSRLAASQLGLKVRCNVPYRGRSDCHCKTYRDIYASSDYTGIELEINQALVADRQAWKSCKRLVTESLRETLGKISADQ